MPKVRAGTIALFVLSLPMLVGIFVYGPFVLDLFLHRGPPARFLIPYGHVGWVQIEYRVPNAPPLPREGKYLLVRGRSSAGILPANMAACGEESGYSAGVTSRVSAQGLDCCRPWN